MTQDIKQRVEEAKRILNYERPDIQHASDLARVTYHKQDVQYIYELIKDLTKREEKLVAKLKEGAYLRFASVGDAEEWIEIALYELGINPTNGDV